MAISLVPIYIIIHSVLSCILYFLISTRLDFLLGVNWYPHLAEEGLLAVGLMGNIKSGSDLESICDFNLFHLLGCKVAPRSIGGA